MFDEEKSWWKKKGFYTSACVLLVGVMAVGAVAFRNAKMKDSQKMLAKIEEEIPADGGSKDEEISLEASKAVTPVPELTETEKDDKEKADAEKEQAKKLALAEKKAEKEAAERKKKIEKAAKEEAKAVAAKIKHAFNAEKGLLWPVKGEVLLKYSMDKTIYFKTLAQYKYNPGILIQAEKGDEVKAAADGKVTEVAEDDDYGTIIRVDLGDDYMLTYGQITDVKVKAGDEIKEGDVIAKIAEPTKYFSEEGSHLYLQVKQGEENVDPLLLLR